MHHCGPNRSQTAANPAVVSVTTSSLTISQPCRRTPAEELHSHEPATRTTAARVVAGFTSAAVKAISRSENVCNANSDRATLAPRHADLDCLALASNPQAAASLPWSASAHRPER